ncbi:MAG: TetR/AcrR family transcriptional regulator [Oceanicaulis sp.]
MAKTGMTETALQGADARGVTAADGSAKAKIERAALIAFAVKGVDGVSTREIANAAGVSEGLIYRHFKSKDGLALSLFETIHARLYDLVAEALDGADDFPDAVSRVVAAYCKAADEDRVLFEYHLTHMFRFGRVNTPGRPDPTALIARRIAQAMADGACPRGDAEIKTAAALGVVLQPAAHRMAGRFDIHMENRAGSLARAAYAALKEA